MVQFLALQRQCQDGFLQRGCEVLLEVHYATLVSELLSLGNAWEEKCHSCQKYWKLPLLTGQ